MTGLKFVTKDRLREKIRRDPEFLRLIQQRKFFLKMPILAKNGHWLVSLPDWKDSQQWPTEEDDLWIGSVLSQAWQTNLRIQEKWKFPLIPMNAPKEIIIRLMKRELFNWREKNRREQWAIVLALKRRLEQREIDRIRRELNVEPDSRPVLMSFPASSIAVRVTLQRLQKSSIRQRTILPYGSEKILSSPPSGETPIT
jgi:hypothetical protein